MRRQLVTLIAVTVALAACGGDDDDTVAETAADTTPDAGQPDVDPESGSPDDTTVGSVDGAADTGGEASEESDETPALPAGLPAECSESPFDLVVTMGGFPQYAGSFPVDGAVGVATPIVPNGDGSLDDLDIPGFKELAADTDLLTYTQWVGDFPFGLDELGFLGGAPTLPGENVAFGLSVTPPTEAGLAAGDVVSSDDELMYDSITTFGTATVFLVAPDDVETYLMTNGMDETHGGTATVLYVDDDWLCVDWALAGGTRNPDGKYSVSGVVLTPLVRGDTPFT